MPKFKLKRCRDPYLNHLQSNQFGKPNYGDSDILSGRLAKDLLNSSVENYYEYSDQPFYARFKYGKGREIVPVTSPGGVFNLEFSSDGKLLAAACEKKNILIFDPLRQKLVHSIDNAHTDCVNCIRYVVSFSSIFTLYSNCICWN